MLVQTHVEYQASLRDPRVIHAICEDYRAAATIDLAHDHADRAAGRRVECPTLVLWATEDDMEDLYGDPLEIWRPWTNELRGAPIQSGHHMAEEAPDGLAAELLAFLG